MESNSIKYNPQLGVCLRVAEIEKDGEIKHESLNFKNKKWVQKIIEETVNQTQAGKSALFWIDAGTNRTIFSNPNKPEG